MSHTPGPWKWFNYPDGRKLLSGQNRAVIHCPDARMSVEPADQALLSAAPDLFEALVMVRDADNDCRRDGLTTIPVPAREFIDRALAKAEGR
jgi:hypothetical protein